MPSTTPAWAMPSPTLVRPSVTWRRPKLPVTHAAIENGIDTGSSSPNDGSRISSPTTLSTSDVVASPLPGSGAGRAYGVRSLVAPHAASSDTGSGSGGAGSNRGGGSPPGACGGSQSEMIG